MANGSSLFFNNNVIMTSLLLLKMTFMISDIVVAKFLILLCLPPAWSQEATKTDLDRVKLQYLLSIAKLIIEVLYLLASKCK